MNIETLGDIIRHHASERPATVAMTLPGNGGSWTYEQLDGIANRVANALIAEGLDPQGRVAYLGKNAPEFFFSLFGAAKANCVLVTVNWRLSGAEIAYILNNSDCRLLIVDAESLPQLRDISLPNVKVVVVGAVPPSAIALDQWLAAAGDGDPRVPCKLADTAIQIYTSGTTGRPKGVELSHASILHCVGVSYAVMNFDEQASVLVCLPLFHIGGSGWSLVALYHAARLVLLREVDLDLVLRVIPQYRITHAPLVPTVIRSLMQHPRTAVTDFSSLRVVAYGASPNSESDLKQAMEVFGCGLYGSYGLSESSGSATLLRPEDHDIDGPRRHLLRSCGQLVPDHECRIVSTDTLTDLPDGEVGEIWLRGPQVMKGYWRDPAATADALLPDGWLRTGDAGYLKEGYLYIKDRVKDMIISGGENIYPAEVENVLMKHDKIVDCAVIGVPSKRWGETVKAVVCASDRSLTEIEVIQFCRDQIAHYKCPTSVSWVSAIPRGTSGKILKTELRKRFALT